MSKIRPYQDNETRRQYRNQTETQKRQLSETKEALVVNNLIKEPVSLTPGTVITIPAEVKHWHGAKADSWFSHIAVEVPGEETSNEWCEPVTDEEYGKL